MLPLLLRVDPLIRAVRFAERLERNVVVVQMVKRSAARNFTYEMKILKINTKKTLE